MTPDTALAAILAEFPEATAEARLALHTDDCIDITSGGLRADRDVEPALYASRELAIANFQREALTILRERAPASIAFTDGPHVDKWHITVMDKKGTQRVTEARFSVTATIGLIFEKPQSIEADASEAAASVAELQPQT